MANDDGDENDENGVLYIILMVMTMIVNNSCVVLGVTCIHIPSGITKTTFQEGLTIYSDKFDSSNKNH